MKLPARKWFEDQLKRTWPLLEVQEFFLINEHLVFRFFKFTGFVIAIPVAYVNSRLIQITVGENKKVCKYTHSQNSSSSKSSEFPVQKALQFTDIGLTYHKYSSSNICLHI